MKLTEVDPDCIRTLAHKGFWDVLVPFEQKVQEVVPDFYHQDKLKRAIRNHQNVYIKALFSHNQSSVALKEIGEVMANGLKEGCSAFGCDRKSKYRCI